MEYESYKQFRVKCLERGCHYKNTADTLEEAVELAEDHIGGHWRDGFDDHEIQITEVTIVKKAEDQEDE